MDASIEGAFWNRGCKTVRKMRDGCPIAYQGHDIAMASCLGTQHTEAILSVVICDALDQAGQYSWVIVPAAA